MSDKAANFMWETKVQENEENRLQKVHTLEKRMIDQTSVRSVPRIGMLQVKAAVKNVHSGLKPLKRAWY